MNFPRVEENILPMMYVWEVRIKMAMQACQLSHIKI